MIYGEGTRSVPLNLISEQKNAGQKNIAPDVSSAPIISIDISTSIDPHDLARLIISNLDKAANEALSSQPSPPYSMAQVQFLRELGPLLFSIAVTEQPWHLEADVYTLPVSPDGVFGGLAQAWQAVLATGTLEEFVKKSLEKTGISPAHPVHAGLFESEPARNVPSSESEIPDSSQALINDLPRYDIILATAREKSGQHNYRSAVDACIATIQAAAKIPHCQTLILPIIGAGAGKLEASKIIPVLFQELDVTQSLGNLKHIILIVDNSGLLDELTGLAEEVSAEPVRSQRLENDLPQGEDKLDIKSEVYALADAIALQDMKPPLVVGVLGGWGTGKSFVLHLLKERLREIRCWDLRNKKLRRSFPFVGHPYLVHFDAWTFAKSDLWASLMQKIYFDLDQQLSLEKTIGNGRRELLYQGVDIWSMLEELPRDQIKNYDTQLMQEVLARFDSWKQGKGVSEALWDALQEKKHQELEDLNEAKTKLLEAEESLANESQQKNEQLQQQLDNERHDFETKLEGVQKQYEADLAEQERQLKLTQLEVDAYIEQQKKQLVSSEAWKPVYSQLKSRFGVVVDEILKSSGYNEKNPPPSVWDVAKEISVFNKLLRGQSPASIVFLVIAASSPLMGEWFAATFEKLKRRAGMTGRNQSIHDLIQERNESQYYDEKLGVVHQVQEDLSELTDALLPVNRKSKTFVKAFPRGIPRIILVIDDLDRCPPGQVVKVLEAAQLLVKTELFVVVLAMDVRYVTRALEKKYQDILVRDGEPSGLDYIEKIVQIPYRVPEIVPTAMRVFLQHQMTLLPEKTEEPVLEQKQALDREKQDGQIEHPTRPAPVFFSSAVTVEGDSAPLPPTQIQYFEKNELDLLEKCSNTVGVNPRAARRLVNVFKLMKIIWFHRGMNREPIIEVKQIMMLLLALSTRYPVVMREVVHVLDESLRNQGSVDPVFKEKLRTAIKAAKHCRLQPEAGVILEELIASGDVVPEQFKNDDGETRPLNLSDVGHENIRLVRSFSFVGEVSDDESQTNQPT